MANGEQSPKPKRRQRMQGQISSHSDDHKEHSLFQVVIPRRYFKCPTKRSKNRLGRTHNGHTRAYIQRSFLEKYSTIFESDNGNRLKIQGRNQWVRFRAALQFSICRRFGPLVACALYIPSEWTSEWPRYQCVFVFLIVGRCTPSMGGDPEFEPGAGVCVGECGEDFKHKIVVEPVSSIVL